MDDLLELLQTLSQARLPFAFDPGRLVALHRKIPLGAGGVLIGAGLLACFFGGGPIAFRFVLAAPLAAGGWLLGPKLASMLGLAPKMVQPGAAAALGLAALAYPPALIFFAFGVAGGLLGGELAGQQDYWLGFLPGFLLAACFSLPLQRFVSMLLASLIGASALTLGLVTVLANTRFAGLVTGSPALTVAAALCIAIASLVYQMRFTPTEEEREQRRAERQKEKHLAEDAKQREKRFKAYDKKATEARASQQKR